MHKRRPKRKREVAPIMPPRRIRLRKYTIPAYIKEALQSLRPPEDISVSEWAERYRILTMESSAMPGPWRNSKTPYLVGIMDEFRNYDTEEIVFVKSTQIGGTEALLNMLGFVIQQDPAPTMIVYPSDQLGERASDYRLKPMFRASKVLKERWWENASSKLEQQFDGMHISITGANSPADLASQPIRFLFLDEVDKFPGASKKEADPIKLARERTKTYHNRKIYMTSTPTLRTGHIWKAMEDADAVKHYFVPCPHCGELIELKWNQVRFPDKEGMSYAERADLACYVCQSCGGVIRDQDKPEMLRYGEWRTVEQKAETPRKVAYWINVLYSPFVRFSEMAAEFLSSKADPEKLQNFVNSWLAEPWEDTKLKTSADLVMDRQTDLPEFTVPNWAKLLTAGVDVQESSLYWTIRAWGDYITSQNIAHGQAYSFREIESVMNLSYKREDGSDMVVQLALIDSGDNTDAVYDFTASNSDWALPSKGSSHPMMTHYKVSTVNRPGSRAQGQQLIMIDTGKYKDMIAGRMKKENGTGSWMVYQGCDLEYAEQVTAEHKVNEKGAGGRVVQVWRQKTSHADNHYLDCEVYAMCAADILGVRSLHLQEVNVEPREAAPKQKTAATDDSWLPSGGSWL